MTNLTWELLVFNVGLWQSIFFHPKANPFYWIMVDSWHDRSNDFHPIDFLIDNQFLHHDWKSYWLSNLTITNYDHDHFSGLPHLRKMTNIRTTTFSNNFSSDDLQEIKEDNDIIREPLEHLIEIKDTYIYDASQVYKPPFERKIYVLWKEKLPDFTDTNNGSQVIFIKDIYSGIKVCIAWDIEDKWRDIMFEEFPEIQNDLKETHLFIAWHHWRENWYHEKIFQHCKPGCIIISDKEIIHWTQENMSQKYWNHVIWEWIDFNWQKRKVLTTRCDWHIKVSFFDNFSRWFNNFST